ncbi:tRNA (adenosine(37)-N6)-dimethylallyltransferase MiaA [Corynebacterium spheniscorum]|uniref:tRNA dimethylallyltransferase n=1 Tax=Corynebacterium spheniscorum TaxID=185761 RepID=A0A1I2R2E2_9CORY|nr:tRNA (adenosine(37)-N6)-dimethylallyltransferase MiaA [Corynebacterium spheniscorum]KAA8722947.1 tRNA (adenosine(37)-N6)-dimethylallyltransferase MiaA [Corynebacterium spheniscorum]SFG34834.1 tRNA dimethylallyltransferase [Corynebacterium spheniscorum]
MTPTPIAVVGPTASGKSALGLGLAESLNGEVVNVDSMQLYRGMDIGTAKLPVSQRRGIPHHQLDVLDVTEKASVARYQREAIRDVEDILARGKTPILVGGSMLYVQSLIDDWQFPPTDPTVRARLEAELADIGIDAMHKRLRQVDPQAANKIEDKDPRRTVRALEVIELTGQPFQASQPPKDAAPRWGTRILGLKTEAEWLNPRIQQRTQEMFTSGFIEEVEYLKTQGLKAQSTAGLAIGYAQVLNYLDPHGDIQTVEEACELTTVATRRYVRRQRSWFKRDPRTTWLDAREDTLPLALDLLG